MDACSVADFVVLCLQQYNYDNQIVLVFVVQDGAFSNAVGREFLSLTKIFRQNTEGLFHCC